MAAQNCPHCGAVVAAGRNTCKACGKGLADAVTPGAPIPAAQPIPKKGMHPLAIVACVLAGVLLMVGALAGGGRSQPRSDDPIAAYVACKEFVGNQLKAPTQAQWPTANEAQIASLGGGAWRVASYVDAPNSLGVMLRNDYTCEVMLTPGKWAGRKLIFGGAQVYP